MNSPSLTGGWWEGEAMVNRNDQRRELMEYGGKRINDESAPEATLPSTEAHRAVVTSG